MRNKYQDVVIIEGDRTPIGTYKGSLKNIRADRLGSIVIKEVVFFLGITNQEKVSISSEHQKFVWLQYESAHERLTYDNAKKTLKKAFDFHKNLQI